jgi:hypothetical protein
MFTRLGSPGLWIGIFSVSTCCTVSCQPAGLADFAKPKVQAFALGSYDIRDPIRYRSLTRADFRAKSPPADIAEHATQMGAYTCAVVVPGEDQELDLSYDAPAGAYVARVLRFEVHALMDPDCSWWNPGEPRHPPEYVLQHAQIHFALAEIEARELAQRLKILEVRADTAASAAADLQRKIRSAFQDSATAFMESNTSFDEDTSGGYRPQKQARWLAYVEEELRLLPASPERPAPEYRQRRAQPEWEPL